MAESSRANSTAPVLSDKLINARSIFFSSLIKTKKRPLERAAKFDYRTKERKWLNRLEESPEEKQAQEKCDRVNNNFDETHPIVYP